MPIDLTAALAHVDGDLQLLAELAAMFLQDYPRLLNETRDSAEQGDFPRLERAAHTLKGRLAFFGVEKAKSQAQRLETMGREQDIAGIRQALVDLEFEVADSLAEFAMLAKEQRP
jgi:two-component system, sensor histidine kinase and response regulator